MSPTDRSRFVDAVLDAYTATPGTTGHVRSADRRLASDLFDHHVPLDVVTAAFALAASRRVNRPDNAVPLQPVRSLYYFKPVIDELLRSNTDPVLLSYIRNRLQHLVASD